jgi:L-2,4-diaminobutyrate decarboxylase
MTDSTPPASAGTLPPPRILAEIESDASVTTGSAFVDLVAEYFDHTRDRAGSVSTPVTPSALAERFDEPLPRCGQSIQAVIDRLRSEIIPSSNHLWHPRYVGHQIAGPLPAAVWTESVTASLNQSLAVFEMSPVGTVLEHRVIGWMCQLAGFPPGSGGTMTSGGTEATFTGLLAARGAALPDAWTNGVGSEPPLLVCGEHAHYAVTRAAGELGLGMRNVRVVRSRDFRMDPAALDSVLAEIAASGRRTMAVVATAGSTATGSFDDLDAIASTCDRHGVWLHVDAAHGGSALLSTRHRAQLRGIERARSIAWDPHKMMLLPSQAGMLLVRDERDLDAAFSQRAPYLFHGVAGDRAWDQGTRSFLCSRRADVLKLWVALQRHGADALGELYDYFCALTRYAWQEIAARDDFEALHEPEGDIICFRYVGDRTLGPEAVDAVNRELRERYNRSGAGWVTGTVLGGRRVLRVTLMNPRTNQSDICAILDGLAAVGREITA